MEEQIVPTTMDSKLQDFQKEIQDALASFNQGPVPKKGSNIMKKFRSKTRKKEQKVARRKNR